MLAADDAAPNPKAGFFSSFSPGAGVPVGVTPNPKSFLEGPGVVLVLSPPDTDVAAVDGTEDMVTAPTSPNLNPLKPPAVLGSGGFGEGEPLAGALMVCGPSFEAARKGEGLDEENPWKPPKVGFGSAGFSVVAVGFVVWDGPPKPPNADGVGLTVGAVVVTAGIVAVCANVPNAVGFGSAGFSVAVVVVLPGVVPKPNVDFGSGGLSAGVVLGCPNPNPLNAGLTSEGLCGVEVGAVVATLKEPKAGFISPGLSVVIVDMAVGALPNTNAGFVSAGLSVVVAVWGGAPKAYVGFVTAGWTTVG